MNKNEMLRVKPREYTFTDFAALSKGYTRSNPQGVYDLVSRLPFKAVSTIDMATVLNVEQGFLQRNGITPTAQEVSRITGMSIEKATANLLVGKELRRWGERDPFGKQVLNSPPFLNGK